MKKPLLTAKELELVKEFPADNLSLVPKIISNTLKIVKNELAEISPVHELNESTLFAELKNWKVLNKDPSSTRPIYYYDFSVKLPENSKFEYQPGDSFGFYPELSIEEVEFLAEKLHISLEEAVNIIGPIEGISLIFPAYKISENPTGFQVKTRDVLRRLDVRGFPKKAVLRTLAEYCQDENEARILLFLSSRNGSDAYNRLRSELMSVQMLLAALDSLKPTLEVLVNIVGPLQPRYYSCCRKQPEGIDKNSFQIVFNVNEFSPESAPEFKQKGVCAGWLESLKNNSNIPRLPILQRSISHFRLPETISQDRPILMIAAGTGVAPFVGFLEVLKNQQVKPVSWLIFGFRNLHDDYIFQDELESFKIDGSLSKLSLAVSRDPVEPKTYVQDVIRKEKDEFFHLLNDKDGLVYVCGDELTMIKGVNEAITEIILEKNSEMTQKEADALLMKWTKEKKIIRDIWV